MMYSFRLRGKTYKGDSFEKVSELYCALRDQAAEGASSFPTPKIRDASGRVVGRISYNGRIWKDEPWTPEAEPLFTPLLKYVANPLSISIPVFYKVRHVPPLADTPLTSIFMTTAPLRFTEVGEDEAPVIARIEATAETDPVEFRMYKGQFWKALGLSGERVKEMTESLSPDSPLFDPEDDIEHYLAASGGKRCNPETLGVVLEDNQNIQLAKMYFRIEDFITIDGDVWERSVEPIYVVEGTREGKPKISVSSVTDSHRHPRSAFRLDEFDLAVSMARSLGAEEVNEGLRAEVLHPEVLTFDRRARHFYDDLIAIAERSEKEDADKIIRTLSQVRTFPYDQRQGTFAEDMAGNILSSLQDEGVSNEAMAKIHKSLEDNEIRLDPGHAPSP